MEVRKSIVLNIDSDIWVEFRRKTIAEDIAVGSLIKGWIKEWIEEDEES